MKQLFVILAILTLGCSRTIHYSGNPVFKGWYADHHRRPPGQTDRNAREVCIDLMEFDEDGFIKPVTITKKGLQAFRLRR